MSPAGRAVQPRGFASFRCLAADCEDTCCSGWGVLVDRETFDKYRACADPELRPRFDQFVQIRDAEPTDNYYATLALSGTYCVFLSGGLCSIQERLGEEYLSRVCSTYPRVMNTVDGTLERSLDVSCPEAARIVLLDREPMEVEAADAQSTRLGYMSWMDTSAAEFHGTPFAYFPQVRELVLWLLRYRSLPLWQRLVVLGYFCDKLSELAHNGATEETPKIVDGYRQAVENGLFYDSLRQYRAQPAKQLEIAAELLIDRIRAEYISPRLIECHREFMQGVEWTGQSTLEGIAGRYADAARAYFLPFMKKNEHMMENYLSNYVYRTLFPFGAQKTERKLGLKAEDNTISHQYMLMMAYYALVRCLLVGMAGLHQSAFGADHVVKAVQTCARMFEHSFSAPGRILETLAKHGLRTAESMALLIVDD